MGTAGERLQISKDKLKKCFNLHYCNSLILKEKLWIILQTTSKN
jgi:hypothetical protein